MIRTLPRFIAGPVDLKETFTEVLTSRETKGALAEDVSLKKKGQGQVDLP